MSSPYAIFDSKESECPITYEKGDTLVITNKIPCSKISEKKQEKLRKQFSYISQVQYIEIIYFKYYKITEQISKLTKCPISRKEYTDDEKARLLFKYRVKDIEEDEYNKLDSDKKKDSSDIYRKYLKMEHLKNFYDPYKKTDDKYAIWKADKEQATEKKLKWIVRKSNSFKPDRFMYDEEKDTFTEAQKKYTIWIPKLNRYVFIIYDMGEGYKLEDKLFGNNFKKSYTNLYDCLQDMIERFVED